jgi:hypothetical protein
MHPSRSIVCLVATASCILAEPTPAQDPGHVTIDARRCMDIESSVERLACFEAEVNEADDNERDDAAAPAPASATTPPAPSPQASPASAVASPQSELVGTIAVLRERIPGRYLITLDSGDVWEQRIAERYPLRVGQRVRIYASKWGRSQRLEADGLKGFIQVDRVR